MTQVSDILDAHEMDERKQGYITEARQVARRIAQERGFVNVNMIRDAIGGPPEGVDPRCMGAILRPSNGFCPGEYTQGTRNTSHKRPVRNFTLEAS